MVPRERCPRRGRQERLEVLILASVFVSLPLLGCWNCFFPGDFVDYVVVRGKVLDADTLEGLSDTPIGVRTLTAGEVIGFVSGVASDRSGLKSPPIPLTGVDGTFAFSFTAGFREPCTTILGPRVPTPDFPRPDQIEVTVVRDACEQSFLIDINEDTVVDLSFPDDVIELKDPILVPPCEE